VGWGGAAAAADDTHQSGLHTVLPRGRGADALFPHFDYRDVLVWASLVLSQRCLKLVYQARQVG
jgi:hypothetical protein